MKYIIGIDNLESNLSEREIEKAVDDLMCDIAENYGEVRIDVMEEEE